MNNKIKLAAKKAKECFQCEDTQKGNKVIVKYTEPKEIQDGLSES